MTAAGDVLAEQVSLEVAGRAFAGWQSVEITAGLEQAARSWTVGASLGWPGQADPFRVRPGAEAIVRAGADVVCTGYVDRVEVSYDASSCSVQLSGRSRTCDAIDCSVLAEPATFRRQTLAQIARLLCVPYGIEVVDETGDTTTIDKAKAEPGGTVYETIERLARTRGVLVTDDAEGRLVLTRGRLGPTSATTLRAGAAGNILSGSVSCDASELYSEIRVKGQRGGADLDSGEAICHAVASAADDDLGRTRVLLLQGEGRMDRARCASRATWEAATRTAKAVACSYEVQGWRRLGGVIWAPGDLVPVVDEIGGVDAELLLVSVAYQQSDAGTIARLELAPVAAYELEEPAKQPAKKRPRAGVGVYQTPTTAPALRADDAAAEARRRAAAAWAWSR